MSEKEWDEEEEDESDNVRQGLWYDEGDLGDEGRETLVLYAYCGEWGWDARAMQRDIQTLCGSRVERDDDFLYVAIDPTQLQEAQEELEASGYALFCTGY